MNELVVLPTNAVAIYGCNAVDGLIKKIEDEARSVVPNLETAAGRKEIASLAHKISRSKTTLDTLGKNLVADWKEKSKAVDNERKTVRDKLDALRDEIRKPLTDWELAEQAKAEASALAVEVERCHEIALIEHDLWARVKADEEREAERLRIEAEAQEAERLKVEAQERADREARIAKESADKARLEAEEAARQQRVDDERRIAEALAAEERAKREKVEAALAAETRRLKDIADAEEAVRRDAETKRLREIDEQLKIDAENQRNAANKAHQKKINNESLADFVSAGITEDDAKTIVILIASGKIRHLTINY